MRLRGYSFTTNPISGVDREEVEPEHVRLVELFPGGHDNPIFRPADSLVQIRCPETPARMQLGGDVNLKQLLGGGLGGGRRSDTQYPDSS